MTTDERAKLASEILQVRQDIETLYQSAYNAFVEATATFGKMMQPILAQQVDIMKRLMKIEDQVYQEFKNDKE